MEPEAAAEGCGLAGPDASRAAAWAAFIFRYSSFFQACVSVKVTGKFDCPMLFVNEFAVGAGRGGRTCR